MFDSSVGGGTELARGWRINREPMASKYPGLLISHRPRPREKCGETDAVGKGREGSPGRPRPEPVLAEAQPHVELMGPCGRQHSQAKPQDKLKHFGCHNTANLGDNDFFESRMFKIKNSSSHTCTYHSQIAGYASGKFVYFFIYLKL